MKILKSFSIAIIALGMFTACEKSTNEVNPDFSIDPEQSSRESVTVGFKAKFYTDQVGEMDDLACGDEIEADGILLNIQNGNGKATHLNEFSTDMEFCFDLNGDPSTNPDYASYDGTGYFTAEDGDILNFRMDGQVKLYPEPVGEYIAWFKDYFVFTGGTGRFEGATGGGQMDSQSKAGLTHTDHVWKGNLTLLKGSK